MGREADPQIVQAMGLYPDEDLQRYVDTVGRRLAAESERPDLPWTFRVIDDATVNAFALPGGFIYLTRGIMTHFNNEAEMAAVLGHEIGHVTARHQVEQLSRQQLAGLGLGIGMILSPELRQFGDLAQTGLGLLFLKYGRDDERQADDLGLRYMVSEDYDPRQMPNVFETLARVSASQGQGRIPAWLSTHPDPGARAERARAALPELAGRSSVARVARSEYLGHLDGTVYGEDPRQGFFRGTTFYHPELAFSIDFPRGWRTVNQRAQVGAISPENDAVVVLTLAAANSAEAAARDFFNQQGLRSGQARASRLNGLEAVSGPFQVSRGQGTADIVGVAAFVEHRDQVYRLLGYSTQTRWGRHDAAVSQALESFDRVTDRRILDVEPARIDVVRIPSEMTLREFQRRYAPSADLETLALINQVGTNTRLAAGLEVKRLVGGELPR
jgi:predicted Zn-dependent protease